MLPLIITTAFLALTLLPQTLMADTSVDDCISSIQSQWSTLSGRLLTGETRHKTKCQLDVTMSPGGLSLHAEGPPLDIQFSLGLSKDSQQLIQHCKVDKEKIHLVFEDIGHGKNDKHEKVQLTLLKRQGTGWSMILSQRKLRVLQHTQQNNLICHIK
jgi:hypothetical protein